MGFLLPLLSMIGGAFSSFLGFKGEQAKTVQAALETLKELDAHDAQAITASAQSISAILTQGSWLERTWRPILMLLLIVLIGSWFFGYSPPNFNAQISPMMREVLDLLKVGVIGYVPCRTVEKIVTQMNIGSVLKELIRKKLG